MEKNIANKEENMDLNKDKYIIVEIIPNHSSYKKGKICQIQALKINKLKLEGRFDYRLTDEVVNNITVLNQIKYDNNMFKYTDNHKKILKEFKKWVANYPFLILEDSYTLDYLKYLKNRKELVYPYLNLKHHINVFDEIIDKYNLQPSNHLVDLIYEAIIYESNHK